MQRRTMLATAATLTAATAFGSKTFGQGIDRPWDGSIIAYPDPAIEVIDPSYPYKIGNAAVERLWTGTRWAEGPVWSGVGNYLIWSDVPGNKMYRWLEDDGEVTVYRSPSGNSNGSAFDDQGRLVTCEHSGRRVVRAEHDGKLTVIADSYDGKPLNAPNDPAVHADGAIWFTDPGYGRNDYANDRYETELPEAVYRVDPHSGALVMVTDELGKPNGLCFSPDYSLLYVADSGATHDPEHPKEVRVYDVIENGTRLANGRTFCDTSPGLADGIRCSTDGSLWVAASPGPTTYGVQAFSPEGQRVLVILLPELCANLCFGGRKRNRLFMTASQSLYALYVNANGAGFS